jgi:hypothetical protein
MYLAISGSPRRGKRERRRERRRDDRDIPLISGLLRNASESAGGRRRLVESAYPLAVVMASTKEAASLGTRKLSR